jgi:hypothetical protein
MPNCSRLTAIGRSSIFAQITAGSFGYKRLFGMGSSNVGDGTLPVAGEAGGLCRAPDRTPGGQAHGHRSIRTVGLLGIPHRPRSFASFFHQGSEIAR